ncbi:MAG: histidinol phosphate phosphatase, partial [Candidatus Korarchaeota archaeon]|nr:histidinol phosphate phosphatase [Candidatus Korarchaeota archaeon]NIU82689.1 histidinol phosphate phosphatase [Candidatus Thorarchaeota archaeon]NIW13163.1 histidinol phosphate phosphatase [Candidatus Thorarchaeota archaeon]NIW51264.1 histidinol phosphate phosphatase [Candidatus Korarchaeota archaeon]
QLDILKGIEFGEPHLYPHRFAQLAEKSFDVIIGSVHRIGDHLVGKKEAVTHLTRKEIYSKYYSEVLKAVKFGGFDVLAHLDLPKRYFPPRISDLSIIEEILEAMVKSGIVLEVNTSPLRRGGTESCPDRELLSRYIKKGGKRITLGSDAHSGKTIGEDFMYVQRQLLTGREVQVGVFRNRHFIDLPV